MGRSQLFFPVAGLLVGLAMGGLWFLLGLLFTAPVVAAAVVLAWVAVTGALHFDGLADSADALFLSGDAQRRLAVLKDPHLGAFGLAAGGGVLLLKFAAVLALPPRSAVSALAVAGALGAWAMCLAIYCFPYVAGRGGLGDVFRASRRLWMIVTASAVTIATSLLLLGGAGAVMAVLALLATLVVGRYATARLTGLTGDVYGAICELSQVAVLLAAGPLLG
ncbi:MAG: adenosylcobinamide-GDP ribazoletransferase [Chloroflexi bacterium]|nr:adenosylcobinamide-GDP ribazoletransferase [Chloroflexota bacterium]